MKRTLKIILLVSTFSIFFACSVLAPILGGAAGGAAGSFGGPATAAIGAAGGVTAGQMMFPEEQVDSSIALEAAKNGKAAPGTLASTIEETKGLVWDLGWMYLLIFIVVPFFSKRGRTWMKKFTDLGNTVSHKEIKAKGEEQDARLSKLEDLVSALKK